MNGIKYPYPRVSPQGCIEERSVQVPLLRPPSVHPELAEGRGGGAPALSPFDYAQDKLRRRAIDLCLEVSYKPRPGLNRTPKAILERLSRRRVQFNPVPLLPTIAKAAEDLFPLLAALVCRPEGTRWWTDCEGATRGPIYPGPVRLGPCVGRRFGSTSP